MKRDLELGRRSSGRSRRVAVARHHTLAWVESLERRELLAAPVLTLLPATPIVYGNAGQALPVAPSSTVTDDAPFTAGSLVVNATAPAGVAGTVSVGTGGSIVITGANVVKVGGKDVGTIANNGTGTLTITFNSADATPERVESLVQAIEYTNTDPTVAPSATVSFTLTDAENLTAQATSTINLNDAPMLVAANVGSIATIVEDQPAATNPGTAVSTLLPANAVTDPDGPARGLLVVGVTAPVGSGTWEYKIGAGDWLALEPSGAETVRLGPDDLVRFNPAADFNTDAATRPALSFRAWDQSDGATAGVVAVPGALGGRTPYSSLPVALTQTVTGVNDPPTLNINGTLANLDAIPQNEPDDENLGKTVAQVLNGAATDLETPTASIGLAVIQVDTKSIGTWQYRENGSATWVDITGVSDAQSLLLAATTSIRFKPTGPVLNPGVGNLPLLSFRAWDTSTGVAGTKVPTAGAGTGTSPFSANNASVRVDVLPVADLQLTATGTPASIPTGGTATYTVVLKNDGPAGTLANLTLTLPTLTGRAITRSDNVPVANPAGNTLVLSGLSLANQATLTITVTGTSDGSVTPLTLDASAVNQDARVIDPTPATATASVGVAASVQFVQANHAFDETPATTDHDVPIQLIGPGGTVQVFVDQQVGAVYGTDYVLLNQAGQAVNNAPTAGSPLTFTFTANQTLNLKVRVLANDVLNGGRSFRLNLQNAANGATLGAQITTSITLNDDDSLIVSNTNDSGNGSFRQAIITANASAAAIQNDPARNLIQFQIPSAAADATGRFVINLGAAPLEAIRVPGLVIDASAQSSTAPHSKVVLDGSNQTQTTQANQGESDFDFRLRVLEIGPEGDGVQVIGLGFLGARGSSILVRASDVVLSKIHIGIVGSVVKGGQHSGIVLDGRTEPVARVQVGGPNVLDANFISANQGHGVRLVGPNATDNTIQNNRVGLGPNGVGTTFGNNFDGILLESGAKRNLVGGTNGTSDLGNIVVNNRGSGIRVADAISTLNTISRNVSHSNGARSVVSQAAGSVQPVLSFAFSFGNFLYAFGQVQEPSVDPLVIEFFASNRQSPSDTQTFLGSAIADPPVAGRPRSFFFFTTLTNPLPSNQFLTATSTREIGTEGQTSSASDAVPIQDFFAVTDANDTAPDVSDNGDGLLSLRELLLQLNDSNSPLSNVDVVPISFAIGAPGAVTISLAQQLPTINRQVSIDGLNRYQDPTNPNQITRNPVTLNGLPGSLVAPNFTPDSQAGTAPAVGVDFDGLVLGPDADDSSVINLTLQNFRNGIVVLADNATLTDVYLGVSADGNAAPGNRRAGVVFLGAGNTLTSSSSIDSPVPIAPIGNLNLLGSVISANGTDPRYTDGAGIVMSGAGAIGNTVSRARIGTNPVANDDFANRVGVIIRDGASGNLIGGGSAHRNLISGNTTSGVLVQNVQNTQAPNRVRGNHIGLNLDGGAALPNAVGVRIENAPGTIVGIDDDVLVPGPGNVISGNTGAGVEIVNSNNARAQGNLIGSGPLGLIRLPNAIGVSVASTSGAVLRRNLISANAEAGISLLAGATGAQVVANLIGTNITGGAVLPDAAQKVGVLIDGASGNMIGDPSQATRNVISGNTEVGVRVTGAASGNVIQANLIGTKSGGFESLSNPIGIDIDGPNATRNRVDANVISGNITAGLRVGGGARENEITGNLIGLAMSGSSALGNQVGILLDNAHDNLVGLGGGNTISTNTQAGVRLQGGSTGNTIAGNRIGVARDADVSVPEQPIGVDVRLASANIIGGTTADRRNLISGNTVAGVSFSAGSSANAVLGNRIGSDEAGANPVPNGVGVLVTDGRDNRIGSPSPGGGNLISGNNGAGARVSGSAVGTIIQGNLVGLRANGGTALPNLEGGILVAGAAGTVIGGGVLTPGAGNGNVISGNVGSGVLVAGGSVGTLIFGNLIGTNAAGDRVLGNSDDGVRVQNATGTQVGLAPSSTLPGVVLGNVIAGNAESGVGLAAGATSNFVRGNLIGQNLDAAGQAVALPNIAQGILMSGAGSTGNLVMDNRIGGNRGPGIRTDGLFSLSTNPDRIVGNIVGSVGPGSLPNGGNGVEVQASQGVQLIRNTIAGNQFGGVLLAGSEWNLLDGNNVVGNQGSGVLVLTNSNSNTFTGNQVDANQVAGLVIVNSRWNMIAGGNAIRSNKTQGALLSGASSTTILDTVIAANVLEGVFITGGGQNQIGAGTNIVANQSHGVAIAASNGNVISGPIIRDNFGDGVLIVDASGNQIKDGSRVLVNRGAGVRLLFSGALASPTSNNTVFQSQVRENLGAGVVLFQAAGNAISYNTITSNGQQGILVTGGGATSNRLIGNTVESSQLAGIELGVLSSVSTVSGNWVRNNASVGVLVLSPNNTINAQNIISGNVGANVRIEGANNINNQVLGNIVGPYGDGGAGSNGIGILLVETGQQTIGAPGQGNFVAGNRQAGILLQRTTPSDKPETAITITANTVGTFLPAGSGFVPDVQSGIVLDTTRGVFINDNAIIGNGQAGLLLNNASNTSVAGNLVQGNQKYGVFITGPAATGNVLLNNVIDGTQPGRTENGIDQKNYDNINVRQNQGIVINAAINNLIGPGNTIRENIIGIDVANVIQTENLGQLATYNRVYGSAIAKNLIGVRVGSSTTTAVIGNAITTNIGIGVSLEGTLASTNVVQNNEINQNVGQNAQAQADNGNNPSFGRLSPYFAGTGVFIASGRDNVIGQMGGSTRFPDSAAALAVLATDFTNLTGRRYVPENRINGNGMAGVFVFNQAIRNSIRGNTIAKDANPHPTLVNVGTVNGDYGMLLFNSIDNIDDMPRKGAGANRISSGQIAGFREFTGPVQGGFVIQVPLGVDTAVPPPIVVGGGTARGALVRAFARSVR
jgi:parallel beta-helix repeat protein